MTNVKFLSALYMLALLAACTAMPQTFDERLAYGYSLNTEVRSSAALALRRQEITREEGQNVLETTDKAREFLDIAAAGRDLRSLDLAIDILEAAERYTQ